MTNGRRCMASGLKEDSRAVILIITALLFPVLLAFLALALDVGKIYDLKRRTQNAANAGALGGAYEVYRQNTTYAEVNQAGQEDSIKNGFDDSDSNVTVTINYPYTWQGVSGYVEAIVAETGPTYFARLFNQNKRYRSLPSSGRIGELHQRLRSRLGPQREESYGHFGNGRLRRGL